MKGDIHRRFFSRMYSRNMLEQEKVESRVTCRESSELKRLSRLLIMPEVERDGDLMTTLNMSLESHRVSTR